MSKKNFNVLDSLLRVLMKSLCYVYYKLVYLPRDKKVINSYIPASGKLLDHKELFNMVDASLDMWLTTGRFNDRFEKELAEKLNIKYALTVNSGSSANLLALSALTSHKLGEKALKKGDEVISVAAGFPTTVNPIMQNGLVPVFVDIESNTYNIDPNQIEEAITEKTKAIFVAHTLGNPFNLDRVLDICNKHNLWLIEDNCDALGSRYNNKYTGTFGHIVTLSFYPAHHITMGEGGAVITNDSELYKILMSYRDWGRDCICPPGKDNICKKRFSLRLGNLPEGYDHKYIYSHAGYNLKITDWQAAIALAQLEKLDDFIQRRKDNFKHLFDGLKKHEDVLILPETYQNSDPSWFGFLISVKREAGFKRIELVEHLEANGIGTRLLFSGNILRQPMFINSDIEFRIKDSALLNSKEISQDQYNKLPNTDFIMNNTFWVGVHPRMNKESVEHMLKCFDNFLINK